MRNNSRSNAGFFRRYPFTISILIIIMTSLIIPGLIRWDPPSTVQTKPPSGELIIPTLSSNPTVAGEPNFTRESHPFILKNYPDFSWKNPGQFDDYVIDGIGYNPALPAPGTGPEAYPAIFNALQGLNESNIRIAYLDANYEWELVPYQIDQVGWPNIWQIADLNKWAGFEIPGLPNWMGADARVGMGWINGDTTNSKGLSFPAYNDLKHDWYRIPIHTYVSKYQPDGSYTDENVKIDSEYKMDLVWCYTGHANRPHDSFQQDDSPWRPYSGTAQEAFVNTTDGAAPNTTDASNMVFMGDTWFRTPSNDSANPQWVRDAFPYQQINGALDKDDEIVFYAYPGRKASNWLWWNYSYFPHRFEIEIVDPVDGGHCWMYIYFNNDSAYDPFTGGINLGAPTFTTPLADYVSWDPDSLTVTSDFYQTSVDETNPSLLDNTRLFGETDGQSILESFNKMYGYGEIVSVVPMDNYVGREGTWYSWVDGSANSFSELVCTLDNPSVLYPDISEDTSDPNRTAMTSPQPYYGRWGSDPTADFNYDSIPDGPLGPSIQNWEQNYGDGRAIIDGPCRVIMYLQQYLMMSTFIDTLIIHTTVHEYLDIFTSLLDGPQIYYRRMQLSPPTVTEVPEIVGMDTPTYYIYTMCGNIPTDLRGDYNLTAATEWSGAADGFDDDVPTFGWANGYGWTKIGGLNPKNTTYFLNGSCIPDGNDGVGDYYISQGDPLQDSISDPLARANPANTLPDWIMLTSQTHGGIFIYLPKRELMEIRDNHANDGMNAPNALINMYYRDDVYAAEFGICIDGNTEIVGGASSSPYTSMMIYGDFKHEDVALGHKMYLSYYFPLEGIATFTPQTPAPQFLFDTVQPDKLIYRTGDTVTIEITGTPDSGGGATTDITADFTAVGGGGSVTATDTGTERWSVSQAISSGTGYDRIITFDAVHDPDGPGGTPQWPTSSYNLTITVDDVPPSPAGQLDPLPGTTSEASVLLDWTANPGSDVGSASMANPSGLGKYKLRRGTASGGPYDTTVADNIPITKTQFLDSFVVDLATYYYVLDTYDEAGNFNTSGEVFTTIQLPFTPAQPDDLPATINPSGGITIDWTANPGAIYPPGAGEGYRVFRSEALYLDDALSGTYTPLAAQQTTTTFTDPGPFTEAYFYCYKIESNNSLEQILSAPIHTRVDTVAPAPAELATPFPTYYSEGAEIVVSWAVETIPQYSSGGFPGQDLNGIAYWEIWRQENPPSTWELIATVPHGPATENQQLLDIAVTNGSTYEYRIRTFDGAGNFADNEYTKTTTLVVTGPGVAAVDAVTAGATEVTQGDVSVPITVYIRNPGINDVTLNGIQLYFYDDLIDVTSEYTGASVTGLSQVITQLGGTWSTTFYVDVDPSATLGTIDIWAETTYDTSYTSGGGAYSWLVKPDADLNVQSVNSTATIVHPGEEDIPVTVNIKNPGGTPATLDSVQLVFTREMTDISDKFMVEYVTSMPQTLTAETRTIELKVTVSQGITTGAVTIDATCAGSAMGVPLSDTDGGISTWDWGVQTYPKPVIVSVVADAAVYWDGDTITLTVECDTGAHTVKAWFGNVDSAAGVNDTAPPAVGTTYTIQHLQVISDPPGEGTHDVIVYAENATGTDTYTIPIRTGQAPTFSNWGQIPDVGSVGASDTVDVDIDITDNSGQDPPNVQATLQYRVDGGAWTNIPMSYAGAGHWDATIPAQYGGAVVEYHINAIDLQGNWNVDSHSYTIAAQGTDPEITGESTHEPGNPGNVYTDVPGNGAPFDTGVAYTIDIDTSNLAQDDNYVVLVSAFEPTRTCYIDINATVWLTNATNEVVTLQLQFNTGDFPSGTLITGKVYVLTDLPSNLGRTISWLSFQHLVE